MAEIWGAAIIAGGAIAGGAISAIGAGAAASTQAGAAESAQQTQLQEFNTITQQETPYMNAGYGSLNELNYLLGVTPPGSSIPGIGAPEGYGPQYGSYGAIPDLAKGSPGYDPSSGYQVGPGGSINQLIPGGTPPPAGSSPGTIPTQSAGGGFGSLLTPFTADNWKQLSPQYNFQLQQGQQGVLNQDSSAIGSESGAALKDLISFNQSTANSSFNNAFNMYQTQQGNIYNRLAGIAQLGQTAAANTGQQGTALAGNIGSAQIAAGNAIGGGIASGANAIGNSLNSYAAYSALGQQSNDPYTNPGPSWSLGGGGSVVSDPGP